MNTIIGLDSAIAKDILVSMRRHEQPDNVLETFERCAGQMRIYLSDGMESVAGPDYEEPEDEELEEDFDEEFAEEPEQEFSGMTMTM